MRSGKHLELRGKLHLMGLLMLQEVYPFIMVGVVQIFLEHHLPIFNILARA
ncbi:hypothetical protein D3C76_1478650 [compost metagenome]